MVFKSWFNKGGASAPQTEYTIDDLIVLERYAEAEERLRAKLKTNPDDLHSHLKLAEVYTQLKQYEKAVDEYAFVADEYAQDGFHDKGIALLSRAAKLAPLDASLPIKIDKIQRQKSLEVSRSLAMEGLREAGGMQAGTSALELQRLWHYLAGSHLVQRLSGEQLKRLFSTMELVHLPAGVVVASEGSREGRLLLIVRGVLEAVAALGGRPMALRSFTSGDIVGEVVLLEKGAWPADYRVGEEATVLALGREGLEKNLVGNPDPRAFLEALREQHHDREVASSLHRLRTA